jgi:hypothetical protein
MNRRGMHKKHLVTWASVLVGLTAFSIVPATSAGADPTNVHSKGAHASQLGTIKIDPNDSRIAYVTGRYSCPAGEAHLWVSVKQVADGRPDRALKEEGSSAISAAWLERHPGLDEFTCDGTWHTGTWKIDSFTEYGWGSLVPGQVYAQVCWTGPETAPFEFAWYAFAEQFANAR